MPVEWYAAHLITSIRTKNKRRKWINAVETIYLVSGRTPSEAWKKADKRGKEETTKFSDGGTLENGEAARWQYEGIRKLMSVMNPWPLDLTEDRPVDGTDLTHSQFGLRNQQELKKLVRGKQVAVEYYEQKTRPCTSSDNFGHIGSWNKVVFLSLC